MTTRTAHIRRLLRKGRIPQFCTPCCRNHVRGYASDSPRDPEWFANIRSELMSRSTIFMQEYIEPNIERRLSNTLAPFLPPFSTRIPVTDDLLPLGHHLVWFNPKLPPDQLLSDGTDALHSPGGEWVRRMWAGGSLQVQPEYHLPTVGVRLGKPLICAERITDVQLRGEKDAEKIFITIDRAFARGADVKPFVRSWRYEAPMEGRNKELFIDLEKRVVDQPVMTERRKLVFLKDKTAEELEAMQAGQLAPTKYIKAPASHNFSYSLTPTRLLLFNYSAMTHNAHLIHYDKGYARSVEGHRNLLVHGPLTLTLMLQAMSNFLSKEGKERHAILSIDYRNIAPLYCDEEMRICGAHKKTLENEDTYEIWIEGPTGGMAVKGTLRTKNLSEQDSHAATPSEQQTPALHHHSEQQNFRIRRLVSASSPNESAEPGAMLTEQLGLRQTPTETEGQKKTAQKETVANRPKRGKQVVVRKIDSVNIRKTDSTHVKVRRTSRALHAANDEPGT